MPRDEKVYTVVDVQNILNNELEKVIRTMTVEMVYSVHGRDKIVYNVVKTIPGPTGVLVQIEV